MEPPVLSIVHAQNNSTEVDEDAVQAALDAARNDGSPPLRWTFPMAEAKSEPAAPREAS